MLNAIARIGDYTAGLDLLTFSQVPVVQDAVIRQLMVLGEAANRVSRDMQAQNADVPWRDIIALRNVIVHQYEKSIWSASGQQCTTICRLLKSASRTCSLPSSASLRSLNQL